MVSYIATRLRFYSDMLAALSFGTSYGRPLFFLQGNWPWVFFLPRDHLEFFLPAFLFFSSADNKVLGVKSYLLSNGLTCS